jgi:hypothetical protein
VNVDSLVTGRGAQARFSSAELAARAVALCGWAATDARLDVVGAVLCGESVAGDCGTAPAAWTSAERADPERALGPVRTLVVLTTDVGATVRIAMGGHAWAPTSVDSPAWTIALQAGEQVVVDGRCAYRVDEGTASTVHWTAE